MSENVKSEDLKKDAMEALGVIRETMESNKSEIKSHSEKLEALDGISKEKVEKCMAVVEAQEDKNQELLLLQKRAENSDADAKELGERIENLEKNISKKSVTSPASYKEAPEYKAFNQLLVGYGKSKDFNPSHLEEEHKSYLRTDIGSQGGYTVPELLDTQLQKEVVEITPALALVRTRSLPGVKTLNIPVRTGIPTSFWVGEHEQVPESESAYRLAALTAHALGVKTVTTRDLLNFSGIDMVAEIQGDATEEFSRAIGNAILLGDNAGKPQGLLDSTAGIEKIDSIGSNALTLDDVIKLLGALKTGYNPNFGFNRNTLVGLRTEKDSNGNYLWRIGGESMPSTIIDLPYVILQDMPDVAIGASPVILGDFFRGYTVLDAMGMEVVRDDITQADKRSVIFNWFKFLDGKVTIPEAFKLINIKS